MNESDERFFKAYGILPEAQKALGGDVEALRLLLEVVALRAHAYGMAAEANRIRKIWGDFRLEGLVKAAENQ